MKEYESFKRINTEPFRAYYIPFDKNDKIKYLYGIINKNSSSLYHSLNGEWKIKELERPEHFIIDEELKQTIKVPSCVQLNGFDKLQYINARTPFPVMPPYVPKNNPSYHYRREFEIKKKDNKKYYIEFEGVDSAFHLYVNEKYAGYSQISHSISEFDITSLLNDGINKIDVLVLKWCASSYLECQDKLRFTGIYREVYIIERSKKHITDYKIETNKNSLKFINKSDVDISIKFMKKEYTIKTNKSLIIDNLDIEYWSPENPKLYNLLLESNDEKIIERIGFRDIKIEGRIFKINDEVIKFKGVNRHEFNMKNGASVSLKDTYDDLMLMKKMNVNAIRTSHYPDIPDFYYLCDTLGFYVIDEADLEMHEGATCEGGYTDKAWIDFVNNPIFEEPIYERQVSLLERDKNRCSVIMWSMGNESTYNEYYRKGNKYLRKNDSRPIHYEGMNHSNGFYYSKDFDVVSMMYPSLDLMKKVLDDKKEYRPYLLCEYSHSMGNSNGDLKDYWDLIYNDDRVCGAFIWEWSNHGIKNRKGYQYGGDYGELEHDSNFCIDGIIISNRKIKPATLEMKAIYSHKLEEDSHEKEAPQIEKSNSALIPTFNEDNGELTSLLVNGKEVIASPVRFNVVKYIDNEMYDSYRLKTIKVDTAKEYVLEHVKENNKDIFKCALVSNCIKPLLEYTISYEIKDSTLEISVDYEKKPYFGLPLPRVGIEVGFNNRFKDFKYLGYGPHESYIDRHISNSYDLFESDAYKNYFHYVMPQESGSHYYTKYVEINNLLKVTATKPFSFSYNPYKTIDLYNKKHDYELKEDGNLYLCLDIEMSGVGSHSCGPELDAKYRVKDKNSITFKLNF